MDSKNRRFIERLKMQTDSIFSAGYFEFFDHSVADKRGSHGRAGAAEPQVISFTKLDGGKVGISFDGLKDYAGFQAMRKELEPLGSVGFSLCPTVPAVIILEQDEKALEAVLRAYNKHIAAVEPVADARPGPQNAPS